MCPVISHLWLLSIALTAPRKAIYWNALSIDTGFLRNAVNGFSCLSVILPLHYQFSWQHQETHVVYVFRFASQFCAPMCVFLTIPSGPLAHQAYLPHFLKPLCQSLDLFPWQYDLVLWCAVTVCYLYRCKIKIVLIKKSWRVREMHRVEELNNRTLD